MRKLKPSEISDHSFEQGMTFFREQPAATLALYWKKLRLPFGSIEISNNKNVDLFFHHKVVLSLPVFLIFWMLALLAPAGVVTLPKDRWWWLFNGFAVMCPANLEEVGADLSLRLAPTDLEAGDLRKAADHHGFVFRHMPNHGEAQAREHDLQARLGARAPELSRATGPGLSQESSP